MEATTQVGNADAQLLSFGPSFGDKAKNEFIQRLKGMGHEYVDDFFCFNMDVPEWCGLRAELKE
jgi:hypothetical protein